MYNFITQVDIEWKNAKTREFSILYQLSSSPEPTVVSDSNLVITSGIETVITHGFNFCDMVAQRGCKQIFLFFLYTDATHKERESRLWFYEGPGLDSQSGEVYSRYEPPDIYL